MHCVANLCNAATVKQWLSSNINASGLVSVSLKFTHSSGQRNCTLQEHHNGYSNARSLFGWSTTASVSSGIHQSCKGTYGSIFDDPCYPNNAHAHRQF
eukprot:1622490-Amphidinium_carterae.1